MEIAESTTFEKRLIQAFAGATLPKIAETLGVNYHTLRNWAKGRSDIPSSELIKIAELTKISLNWLLTGQGEMHLSQPSFDLEYSIDKHESWADVLSDWYEFEGGAMPEFGGSQFMGGWESFTREQKIGAIRDLKMLLDRTVEQ